MKILYLFVFLVSVANAIEYGKYAKSMEHLRIKNKFDEFVKTHDKKYNGPEELADRLKIFAENLRDIESHNKRMDKTWTKGVNAFADLTGFDHYMRTKSCTVNKFTQQYLSSSKI